MISIQEDLSTNINNFIDKKRIKPEKIINIKIKKLMIKNHKLL